MFYDFSSIAYTILGSLDALRVMLLVHDIRIIFAERGEQFYVVILYSHAKRDNALLRHVLALVKRGCWINR